MHNVWSRYVAICAELFCRKRLGMTYSTPFIGRICEGSTGNKREKEGRSEERPFKCRSGFNREQGEHAQNRDAQGPPSPGTP